MAAVTAHAAPTPHPPTEPPSEPRFTHDEAWVLREVKHVCQQAWMTGAYMLEQLDRLEKARGKPEEPAVAYQVKKDINEAARQLSRAHASMVPRTDRRYQVAQRVIAYCDEPETGRRSLPPVRIGRAA